jgi:hypothetical protein
MTFLGWFLSVLCLNQIKEEKCVLIVTCLCYWLLVVIEYLNLLVYANNM